MNKFYNEKAKLVKAEKDAKIATLEQALNTLGVETEETETEEVTADEK